MLYSKIAVINPVFLENRGASSKCLGFQDISPNVAESPLRTGCV